MQRPASHAAHPTSPTRILRPESSVNSDEPGATGTTIAGRCLQVVCSVAEPWGDRRARGPFHGEGHDELRAKAAGECTEH